MIGRTCDQNFELGKFSYELLRMNVPSLFIAYTIYVPIRN